MAVQQSVVPAIGRSRRRTKSSVGLERQVPALPPLPSALEGLFVLVSEPVLKLETSPDAQMTLREISILLGDVLDLLEEEQTILQAALWSNCTNLTVACRASDPQQLGHGRFYHHHHAPHQARSDRGLDCSP